MTGRVLVRADASTTLGAGHVMRCLVLAERLRALGVTSHFLCRRGPGDLIRAVLAAGHTVTPLPVAEHEPTDAAEAMAALQSAGLAPARFDWVVADHYRLDARWENAMRQATGARILAIDGQANRGHDADLLLDPVGGPGSGSRWDGLLPATCERLIGPRHALLRAEFQAAQQGPAAGDDEPLRIVVCFGGMDAPGATGRVLQALTTDAAPAADIDVVVGDGHPHHAALATLAARHARVTLHRQPAGVAALMRRAHLAVCAGGGTLIELCALQVPALVLTIADNQRAGTEALARAGCALDLGALEAFDPAALHAALTRLAAPDARRPMRQAQAAVMAPPARDVARRMLDALALERVA